MPAVVKQQKPTNNSGFSTKSCEYFYREKAVPLPYKSLNSGEQRILVMEFDPGDEWTRLLDIPRSLYHPNTLDERLDDAAFSEEYFVKQLLNGDSHAKWMLTSKGICRTTIEHRSIQEGLVDEFSFLSVMNQLVAERQGSDTLPPQL